MQEIGIESSVLRDILEKKKTIEGRLAKDRFAKLKAGNYLSLREDIWQNGQIIASHANRATIRVTQIMRFNSFAEMLESLDFRTIIPSANSIDEALAVYRKFYSISDEEEYGVIAFRFELS